MLMLHPSKILICLLIIFLIMTAYFTFNPFYISFELYLIFFFIVLLFFYKLKIIRYISLIAATILLAGLGPSKVSQSRLLGDSSFVGQVIEEPYISGQSQHLIVKDQKGKSRVDVITNQFPEYRFGEGLKIKGKIEPVKNSKYYTKNKGYFLTNGINYSVYYPEITRQEEVRQNFIEKTFIKFRASMINIRKSYESIISRVLPEPEAGLFAGILLGSRSDLSNQTKDLLAKVGVIHIIALSGYNITVIAEALRKLTKHFSPKLGFYFSILGIWAFVCATGFSASVVRAAIMGSVVLYAKKIGRQANPIISILLASSLMVLTNPYILVYDIGFQLSFAAVCGMIFFTPLCEKFFSILGRYFAPIMAGTFAAQIFTIPIISYYFGRVSVISLAANILVLPFIPLLMLVGFVTTTVGFVSLWLAEKLAYLSYIFLAYFFAVSEKLGSLPYAEGKIQISIISMFLIYLVLLEIIVINRRLVAKKNN